MGGKNQAKRDWARVAIGPATYPRRAVNQFLVSLRRPGETAAGKRHRGARLAFQAGIGPKRRDMEVPRLRPVAELQTERDVNERAGEGAEKNEIGSPHWIHFELLWPSEPSVRTR